MEQGRDRDPGQSIALLEKRGLGRPLNGHRIPDHQSWMGLWRPAVANPAGIGPVEKRHPRKGRTVPGCAES